MCVPKPDKKEEGRAKTKRPLRSIRSSSKTARKPFPGPPQDSDNEEGPTKGLYPFVTSPDCVGNIVKNLRRYATTLSIIVIIMF